mgnify:CR=1 FL=1
MSVTLPKAYFQFLKELKANNHKDWMDAHKAEYKRLEKEFKHFCEDTKNQLNGFDDIERVKVFRINRDIRFSKNKMPYKTNRGAIFSRSGMHRRGSFYFQMAPGASFAGGGFFKPEPADLLRIRKEIELDADPIRNILKQPVMKNKFYKKQKNSENVANDVMKNGILLGCHQGLKLRDLNYVFKIFNEFAKIKKL